MGPKALVLTTILFVSGIGVAFVVLGGVATGTLFGSVTLPNMGTVKTVGVGVYWDSICSNQVTSINWGTINPGSTKDVTVYIKNEGNALVTLSFDTQNWDPVTASSYISLTWDYGGQVIDVGESVQVTFSLTVSETIDGISNFSFDIVISGSG